MGDRGTLYGKGIYFAECVTKAAAAHSVGNVQYFDDSSMQGGTPIWAVKIVLCFGSPLCWALPKKMQVRLQLMQMCWPGQHMRPMSLSAQSRIYRGYKGIMEKTTETSIL